jgi:hypothetical protein
VAISIRIYAPASGRSITFTHIRIYAIVAISIRIYAPVSGRSISFTRIRIYAIGSFAVYRRSFALTLGKL